MSKSSSSGMGLKKLMELLDVGPKVAIAILSIVLMIIATGAFLFIKSAPPTQLTMVTGPDGSTFHELGLKYAKELKAHGVHIKVLTSNGSLDNLNQIADSKLKIDLALVQGGLFDEEIPQKNLVSLGTIRNQPIFFFYRGKIIDRLSSMKGKTIAIGNEGSGTRKMALKLLALNKIKEEAGQSTKLLSLEGKSATQAIIDKKVDGIFIMSGESMLADIRKLMRANDIHLLSFRNAAAYTRKVDYLHLLDLPEGVIDLSQNIPNTNVKLIGVMSELVATKKLHSALSDLILDAATTIHGSPGLFQKKGQFPSPIAHHIKLSDDAEHFYKSGKTLLYRHFPFWLASFLGRFFVVFLPIIILLIPLLRTVPALLRWMGELRIRRRYRALLQLEDAIKREHNEEKLVGLYKNFEKIEKDVRDMRVRAAFAEQFYFLRLHIDYVRGLIAKK
jgi:TRAP-type uncharacterized transport system substrate-binding protein